MIIGGILLFYLSGILVVIGLLIAKVTERQRERKTEKEKFKDYKDYLMKTREAL